MDSYELLREGAEADLCGHLRGQSSRISVIRKLPAYRSATEPWLRIETISSAVAADE